MLCHIAVSGMWMEFFCLWELWCCKPQAYILTHVFEKSTTLAVGLTAEMQIAVKHLSVSCSNIGGTLNSMRHIKTHCKVRSKHMVGLLQHSYSGRPSSQCQHSKVRNVQNIFWETGEKVTNITQIFTGHTSPHLPWITQANIGMAHHLFLLKSRVGHRRRDDFCWHRDVQQRRPETHVFTQKTSPHNSCGEYGG